MHRKVYRKVLLQNVIMVTTVVTSNLGKEVELSVGNSKDVTRKTMFTSVVTNNLGKEVELSVDNLTLPPQGFLRFPCNGMGVKLTCGK